MKFYRFKTFTTSYYFPHLDNDRQYMYGLYSPYGGMASKVYWWLFRHSKLVRSLTAVDEKDVDFPLEEIRHTEGDGSLMAFNMGSPGIEQKISILGYDDKLQMPFFAKFSQKPQARVLTENEIRIYRTLDGTGLTPKLLKSDATKDYVFMKAEYIHGARPKERTLTEDVLQLCLRLADYHLTNAHTDVNGLRMSLSHGDFCPWNLLVDGGHIRIIDWELADDRPLGYDLFTYICQVSALFNPTKPLFSAINEHIDMAKQYFSHFGIADYRPYLRAFAKQKQTYEESKDGSQLARIYAGLVESTSY